MGVTEATRAAADKPHALQSHVAMPAPTVPVSTFILLTIMLIFYFPFEEVIATTLIPGDSYISLVHMTTV